MTRNDFKMSAVSFEQEYQRPVLLLHGMGGSILKNSRDEIIYPPPLIRVLCDFVNWKKEFTHGDLQTYPFGDKRSVDLSISFFSKHRDNYKKLMENGNIYPVSYDFRLIHKPSYLIPFFQKMKEYIESFAEPVVLVNHSSGGILMHYFLSIQNSEWKQKHICSMVNVSVPFTGAFLALFLLIHPVFPFNAIGKEAIQNFGGFIINLPASLKESKHLFDGFSLKALMTSFDNTAFLRESLKEHPGVETHIVYSSFHDSTPIGIETKSTHSNRQQKSNNVLTLSRKHRYKQMGQHSIIYGKGDSVVGEESLLFPKTWKKQSDLHFFHIHNKTHSKILQSPVFIDYVKVLATRN